MSCIKSKIYSSVGLSLIFGIVFSVISGQTRIESFSLLNIETLGKSHVNERVVLFTDREIYICGEKILFNAFSFDGTWFLPVSLSSVLYVEIYNQDNSVISNGKYYFRNGKCGGAIPIPRTVHSDVYYLRAYTNYMKNFGIQQFFVRKLKIVNPNLNPPDYSLLSTDSSVINCRIFPEGGKLIDGIRSRVGCRFTGADGKAIQVIARLVDMNKNVITTFRTYKNGFASFQFVPQTGFGYSIEAVSENAKVEIQMPQSVENGIFLSIDTLTSEYLGIHINSNDNKNFPVRLNARFGALIFPLHETLINSAGTYNIPLQRIPSGLISLELNDFEGNLVASRLTYLKPFKKFEIELNTDKEKYKAREQVNVNIIAKNEKGIPVMTDLVLFANLTSNGSASEEDFIADQGLLIQELMRILDNDYFIGLNTVKDKKLLDMILLLPPSIIQKDTSIFKSSVIYLPELDGDIISGRILYNDNQPASGLEVLQSFVGKISCVESSLTDKNGRFYFRTNLQKNKGDLVLKVQNTDKEVNVILDNEFIDKFPVVTKEKLILTKEEIELVKKQYINIQIDDAFQREMKNISDEFVNDTIPFYGREGIEFEFSQYVNLPNMKEFLFEVILGVINIKENKKDKIVLLEENSMKRLGPNPLILIDGIPVTESEIVITFNVEKVKSIRIVRYKFFYKNQVFDGIMDINTIASNGSDFELPVNTFRYNFVHINEENPVIKIKVLQNPEGKIPHYKNLLYWNSNIKTDKNGKAELSFFTPDNNGNFRIQCFGIAPEDQNGSRSKLITVAE